MKLTMILFFLSDSLLILYSLGVLLHNELIAMDSNIFVEHQPSVTPTSTA